MPCIIPIPRIRARQPREEVCTVADENSILLIDLPIYGVCIAVSGGSAYEIFGDADNPTQAFLMTTVNGGSTYIEPVGMLGTCLSAKSTASAVPVLGPGTPGTQVNSSLIDMFQCAQRVPCRRHGQSLDGQGKRLYAFRHVFKHLRNVCQWNGKAFYDEQAFGGAVLRVVKCDVDQLVCTGLSKQGYAYLWQQSLPHLISITGAPGAFCRRLSSKQWNRCRSCFQRLVYSLFFRPTGRSREHTAGLWARYKHHTLDKHDSDRIRRQRVHCPGEHRNVATAHLPNSPGKLGARNDNLRLLCKSRDRRRCWAAAKSSRTPPLSKSALQATAAT